MSRGLLAGLLVLLCCAPAQAATHTVARSGEYTLHASETATRICMTLRRDRHYQGSQCGRIPRSPHRPLRMFPDISFNTYVVAVPPSVRTAETEDRRGNRKRYATFAARGYSARFVLIPAPPVAVFVRFYAEDGTLLGMDGGPAGYIDIFANLAPVFGTHRDGVEAHTEARIAPSPDQADLIKTLACVDVTNVTGGSGFCDDQAENGVIVMGACGVPDLVGGIVAANVASVRLTLGSGAELTLPAQELAAVFGGRRAIGGQVPGGEAVRDAAALDATGQVVARVAVGTEPGGQPCRDEGVDGDRFSGSLTPTSPAPGAVAVAGSLVVADRGDTLCVGLGALSPGSCPPPPVDSDQPALLQQGRTIAGALSRDAAQITLHLDRGKDVTVPTTDGAAYMGRWAGKVRFFTAEIGAGRKVTGATVRDAAGTIIGISARGIRPRPAVHRTRLAERGGQSLERVRTAGEPPCMTAFSADLPPAPSFCSDPNPGTPIDGPIHRYSAAITVACSPRQAMAYGTFSDTLPVPRIVLDGNRTIRPRTFSLPGEKGWVAFLPDAAVQGLRAGKNRVSLRLPPASRQCGYSATRSF